MGQMTKEDFLSMVGDETFTPAEAASMARVFTEYFPNDELPAKLKPQAATRYQGTHDPETGARLPGQSEKMGYRWTEPDPGRKPSGAVTITD